MRKKSVQKLEKKKCENKCDICKKELKTSKGLKLHMTRVHKTSVACVSCESMFLNNVDLDKHKQKVHLLSPDPKRIKMTDLEDKEDEVDDMMMDADDSILIRSKINDEKVLLKQKEFDEEDKQFKELKRKNEKTQKDEESKKKMKTSSVKKKSKKKTKKDKNIEKGKEKVGAGKLTTKEIPSKYE